MTTDNVDRYGTYIFIHPFSKTLNQSGFMKVFAKNMSVFDPDVETMVSNFAE